MCEIIRFNGLRKTLGRCFQEGSKTRFLEYFFTLVDLGGGSNHERRQLGKPVPGKTRYPVISRQPGLALAVWSYEVDLVMITRLAMPVCSEFKNFGSCGCSRASSPSGAHKDTYLLVRHEGIIDENGIREYQIFFLRMAANLKLSCNPNEDPSR